MECSPTRASLPVLVLLAGAAAAQQPARLAWRFDAVHVTAAKNAFRPVAGALPARVRGTLRPKRDGDVESLLLDGIRDHLVVAPDFRTARLPVPAREMTVSAWVSVDTPQRWGGIVSLVQDNGDAERGWVLGYDQKVFTFGLATKGADDGDGKMTYLAGRTPFVAGRWHHVAGTYDGTRMRLFVDGKLESTSDAQRGPILYPQRAPLALGCYLDANEEHPHHGRLHSASIDARCLTAEQVGAAFRRQAALAAAAPVLDLEVRQVVAPYLQHVTKTGITVMWETSRKAPGFVRFGRPNPPARIASGAPARIHEIRLTGLAPATQYFYQAVTRGPDGEEIASPVYTFQTAVEDDMPFAFTVIGDTQANPAVVRRIAGHCWRRRPHFCLHAGDLVSTGSDKRHWTRHYFPNMHELASRVAVFPVLGNHEQNAALYYRYASLPDPEYRYEFVYGNAHFFMLDTNKAITKGTGQYRWLDDALRRSKARWKFVVHHQPAYTSDSNDYGDTNRGASKQGDARARALVPLYEKHGVDIVWNGHIHLYERTWPIRDGRAVEKGGVIYITTGGAGGGLEQFAPTKTWFSNAVKRDHHYCYVAILGGTLQFQAFDLQGRLFDSMVLKKKTAQERTGR